MSMQGHQNQIPERQNEPRFIRYLAASSSLYSRAKFVAAAQVVLTVVIPLALSVFAILFPKHKIWAALYGIVISSVDVLLLQTLQKVWKREAATVQESFDCELLDMEWNEFRTSDRPTPELLSSSSSKYLASESKSKALRNWYPPVVGKIPLHLARIICQRSNLAWDSSLRRLYIASLTGLSVVILVTLFVVAITLHMDMERFILSILAPISPAVLWTIREVRKQKDSAATLTRLNRYVQALWDSARNQTITPEAALLKSRELQDEIFVHRCSNQPIPNWIYRVWGRRFESNMIGAADDLVGEVISPN